MMMTLMHSTVWHHIFPSKHSSSPQAQGFATMLIFLSFHLVLLLLLLLLMQRRQPAQAYVPQGLTERTT